MIFVDPRGEVVEKLKDRGASGVAKQIEDIARKYPGRKQAVSGPAKLPWVETHDAAARQAKKEGKLLLVVLTDEKKNSMVTEHALADKELKTLIDQFVLHRHVVKRDCELCKQYRVTQGINIMVVDVSADSPYTSPLQKISGKRTARSLSGKLERTLKKWKTAPKDY